MGTRMVVIWLFRSCEGTVISVQKIKDSNAMSFYVLRFSITLLPQFKSDLFACLSRRKPLMAPDVAVKLLTGLLERTVVIFLNGWRCFPRRAFRALFKVQ